MLNSGIRGDECQGGQMYVDKDTHAAKAAYERNREYWAEVDRELLECRQLLYKVSRRTHGLKLLKSVKGFMRMTLTYKANRNSSGRSPTEDASQILLN